MKRPVSQNHDRKGEQGVVLVIVAMGMLALILIAGLCIDFSHFYAVRTELQNAADASALSGASALNGTAAGITEARQRATAAMNKYEFKTSLGQLPINNVYVSTSFVALNNVFGPDSKTCEEMAADTLPPTVQRGNGAVINPLLVRYVGVCTPAPQATQVMFIGSVIGNTMPLRGKAIAGQSPPLTGVCDILAPMALVYDGPGYDPTNTPFVGTQTYTLRTGPHDPTAPGNYQLLELCGPGGSNVRDALTGNCSGCFSKAETICPKCGVTAGPVQQGWNDRTDKDLVTKSNITYAEYQQYESQYNYANPSSNSNSIYNNSGTYGSRIITVPIIAETSFSNGCGNCMQILDFAQFFMQKQVPGGNGGNITAEFMTTITVSSGEFGGAETPITSASLPVLYR